MRTTHVTLALALAATSACGLALPGQASNPTTSNPTTPLPSTQGPTLSPGGGTSVGDGNTQVGNSNAPAGDANAPVANSNTTTNCAVDANLELMLVQLSVVDDPVRTDWTGSLTDAADGAWTLGRQLSTLAGSTNPGTFVQGWLNQLVDDDNILTTQWPAKAGVPDLTAEPLHLLAVVNRLDLRDVAQGSFGELRFVYGTLPTAVPFTNDVKVILEYTVPTSAAKSIEAWALGWHALATVTDPTAYNVALQALTDAVTQAPKVTYRLRTANESFTTNWTFRQFAPVAGQLAAQVLSLTPDRRFIEPAALPENLAQGTPQQPGDANALSAFIDAQTTNILAGTYTMPGTFNNISLTSASFTMLLDYGRGGGGPFNTRIWQPAAQNQNAVEVFSANTCNGCHSLSTPGAAPAQVQNRLVGQASQLSGFLTGTADGKFADLQRRANDMSAVLCQGSGTQPQSGIVLPKHF